MGFRLNLKWGFPIQSHSLPNSPSRLCSSSVRGREASINSARLSFLSIISEEGETLRRVLVKAYACSFAARQMLEKENLHSMIDDNPTEEGKSTSQMSVEARKASHFRLLVQNLDVLEKTFADSSVLRLESDILLQLERLGARNLFDTCLSKTLEDSNDLSNVPIEHMEEQKTVIAMDDQIGKIFVCSRKKEERKSKRARASENASKISSMPLRSKTARKGYQQPAHSSSKRGSNSRGRRLMIARNEAEMSRGVKVIQDLERIRTTLEKETGRVVSLSTWAEAAGIDEKVLNQDLRYGWYCRDELLRSTRSLVLYLARNYRGLGIASEDLLQAGKLGVLQGAERFDHTRGYKLSTYVQYWIRKSMSRMVAQHARGVQIPYTLSRVINRVQKARKALSNSHGKYPDDAEIAKATGISLEKIRSAKKCLRVVGSIDQKMEGCFGVKYMELTPDISIPCPEETVIRQHMIKDLYNHLQGLDQREMQVLILRYGLNNHHPKSLEEIGRLFCVSKEWIRRVEKKALTNLRKEETRRSLIHYLTVSI
uniref:Sigma factor n=1 Tax=Francoa sonchifolia TaxID=23250 RepID=A0A0G2STP9_9ROSI|nr:sigma factor [Francoa sonchifolia]